MPDLHIEQLRILHLPPLSFSLRGGEITVLSGPSGCGKSLLLRAIVDLDRHGGEVRLGGQRREAMSAPAWRRLVGLLPAESHWWRNTAAEHLPAAVDLPLRIMGRAEPPQKMNVCSPRSFPTAKDGGSVGVAWSTHRPPPNPLPRGGGANERFATFTVKALGLPAEALGWQISRLSTGERQRLALLRLLAMGPSALLLDEPTANLDADNGLRVERLIRAYADEHQAPVLWVSHDAAQRQRIADRQLCLEPDGIRNGAGGLEPDRGG
jgi:ABC-type iron transport system FetAB ATPase subunit